jgi:hypothetical protein
MFGGEWRMKESTEYDWDGLFEFLVPLVEEEILAFSAGHQDEEFYGFFFDCNAEYGDVLLCLNTEEGLDEQAEYYQSSWPDRYGDVPVGDLREGFRWNPGDWKYQGFESEDFEKAWEHKKNEVLDHMEGLLDDEDGFELALEQFMAVVGIVAVTLEDRGAFDPLQQSDGFQVMWADHDESWEDSVERMDEVREVLGSEETEDG